MPYTAGLKRDRLSKHFFSINNRFCFFFHLRLAPSQVFDQGLKAISLSVDLWLHYINHCKVVYEKDEEKMRKQYERAIDACGLEFKLVITFILFFYHLISTFLTMKNSFINLDRTNYGKVT